jgi:hypothetical protein
MRRYSACVALFAVLLHAFMPLLASAAPRAAIDHVELCTAQGVVTIEADSGGAPGTPSPDHCPDCAFHAAMPAPARSAHAPRPPAAVPRAFARQPSSFAPPRTASRPRAPPTAS